MRLIHGYPCPLVCKLAPHEGRRRGRRDQRDGCEMLVSRTFYRFGLCRS
jgi:hypothetical protein